MLATFRKNWPISRCNSLHREAGHFFPRRARNCSESDKTLYKTCVSCKLGNGRAVDPLTMLNVEWGRPMLNESNKSNGAADVESKPGRILKNLGLRMFPQRWTYWPPGRRPHSTFNIVPAFPRSDSLGGFWE
eukprot:3679022-Amphidinium_carterae.1